MVDLSGVKFAVGVQRVEQQTRQQAVRHPLDEGFREPAEISEQLPLTGHLHQMQHDAELRVVLLGRRIEAAQVQQGVIELRQEWQEIARDFSRQLEQIFESGGNIPRVRPLMQHEGEHRGQRQAADLVLLGQNLSDVPEQPQRHRRIDRALVFEKQVKQGFPVTKTNGIEQI